MRERTDAEIREFVAARWSDADVEVKRMPSGAIDIEISRMYDAPGMIVKNLFALCDFMETMNISDERSFSQGGCETCDYGSSYGYTLVVRDDEGEWAERGKPLVRGDK